jgi:hypothetical protein
MLAPRAPAFHWLFPIHHPYGAPPFILPSALLRASCMFGTTSGVVFSRHRSTPRGQWHAGRPSALGCQLPSDSGASSVVAPVDRRQLGTEWSRGLRHGNTCGTVGETRAKAPGVSPAPSEESSLGPESRSRPRDTVWASAIRPRAGRGVEPLSLSRSMREPTWATPECKRHRACERWVRRAPPRRLIHPRREIARECTPSPAANGHSGRAQSPASPPVPLRLTSLPGAESLTVPGAEPSTSANGVPDSTRRRSRSLPSGAPLYIAQLDRELFSRCEDGVGWRECREPVASASVNRRARTIRVPFASVRVYIRNAFCRNMRTHSPRARPSLLRAASRTRLQIPSELGDRGHMCVLAGSAGEALRDHPWWIHWWRLHEYIGNDSSEGIRAVFASVRVHIISAFRENTLAHSPRARRVHCEPLLELACRSFPNLAIEVTCVCSRRWCRRGARRACRGQSLRSRERGSQKRIAEAARVVLRHPRLTERW